jgi:hypothetical protein
MFLAVLQRDPVLHSDQHLRLTLGPTGIGRLGLARKTAHDKRVETVLRS